MLYNFKKASAKNGALGTTVVGFVLAYLQREGGGVGVQGVLFLDALGSERTAMSM